MKIKKHHYYPGLLILLLLPWGCITGDNKAVPDENDRVRVELKRYGKALFGIDRNNIGSELERLSGDFYFFIGDSYNDTLSIIQISEFIYDPLNLEAADYCFEMYPATDSLENALSEAFSYYRHYFPDAGIPVVYTYISGLNYENPVNLVDSVMIIALDMYLGPETGLYRKVGIPLYRARRMTARHIVPDCLREVAYRRHSPVSQPQTLLDHMIFHGKVLWFLESMLPETPDEFLTGYTSGQQSWAERNEPDLWAFLIENDLLYSTSYYEINKFIQDGPFTNGFGKESPAMLGRWLGWQIMRSYARKNPDISLGDLMTLDDPVAILRDSGYRPGR